MTYRRPFLEATGPSGVDLIKTAGSRLVGVRIVDKDGEESDEAVFTLTQSPPFFAVPGIGTPYTVKLGWSEADTVITGVYTFQRVHFQGNPRSGRQMQLICRAADLANNLKQISSQHFDKESGHSNYGDVLRTVFKGMNVVMPPEVAQTKIPGDYLLRWKQSPIDFATQLADDNGWVVAPKGGQLVVMQSGSGASGSGKDLPTLEIPFDPNYEYDVELEPRYDYKQVSASYFDPAKGTDQQETKSASGGDGQGQAVLPHPFGSKEGALAAAKAKQQEGASFKGNGMFIMAGEPKAVANAPAKCNGFGPGIDEVDWMTRTVTHDVDPVRGGWITTVETLERGL